MMDISPSEGWPVNQQGVFVYVALLFVAIPQSNVVSIVRDDLHSARSWLIHIHVISVGFDCDTRQQQR